MRNRKIFRVLFNECLEKYVENGIDMNDALILADRNISDLEMRLEEIIQDKAMEYIDKGFEIEKSEELAEGDMNDVLMRVFNVTPWRYEQEDCN